MPPASSTSCTGRRVSSPSRPAGRAAAAAAACRWRVPTPPGRDPSRPTLHDIGLDLPPGHRIAVVGPSGAGKSTLLMPLLGFLPPTRGRLRFGGVDVRDLADDDVRRLVGSCGQEAHIFDASIGDNVRIGRVDASDDELRRRWARAGLLDWVDPLPTGLATPVGEHGRTLSGGQRQRLALARELLADHPLVAARRAHRTSRGQPGRPADRRPPAGRGRPHHRPGHPSAGGADDVDEILVMSEGRIVQRAPTALVSDRGGTGKPGSASMVCRPRGRTGLRTFGLRAGVAGEGCSSERTGRELFQEVGDDHATSPVRRGLGFDDTPQVYARVHWAADEATLFAVLGSASSPPGTLVSVTPCTIRVVLDPAAQICALTRCGAGREPVRGEVGDARQIDAVAPEGLTRIGARPVVRVGAIRWCSGRLAMSGLRWVVGRERERYCLDHPGLPAAGARSHADQDEDEVTGAELDLELRARDLRVASGTLAVRRCAGAGGPVLRRDDGKAARGSLIPSCRSRSRPPCRSSRSPVGERAAGLPRLLRDRPDDHQRQCASRPVTTHSRDPDRAR